MALYILAGSLLFSLAHDSTGVYVMTSEAPRDRMSIANFRRARAITCLCIC